MSDDLVDWLRNAPSNEWCGPMLNKAASEIERLRDVISNREDLCGTLTVKIRELEAEKERARTALNLD